ncbi:glycosyltransferase family 2 protein [Sphingobacterium thalpophilum]|uniref:glycosyltransferase family 2 protein n=1 Tax=Sphingobacterium thalpophilum TaxID=259 RepID=UPI003C78302F
MLLSIITPSFNRSYCLDQIYHSLSQFNRDDFEWILIDDGSTDDTRSKVQSWIEEKKVTLRYLRQDNAGKTNAVISAFNQNPAGKYTLILDSDDVLVPDALDLIKKHLAYLKADEIGLVYLKSNTQGQIIGSKFRMQTSSYINMYFGRYRCYGDKLFVVKTPVYKECLVPAYPDEKLIPEGVIYMNMQQYGKFRCVNEVIYRGDYLTDGLSASKIGLAANNIKGFILEKRMLQHESLDLLSSIKNDIKYIAYSIAGNQSCREIFVGQRNKFLIFLLLLPAVVVSWRRISKIRALIRQRQQV